MTAESRLRITQHVPKGHTKNYEECRRTSDYVGLFQLAKATHIAEPAALAAQVRQLKSELKSLRQNDTDLSKYGQIFTEKVTQLRHLRAGITEEEIVEDFLNSLNASFAPLVTNFARDKEPYKMPKTLSDARQAVNEWYSTEYTVKRSMGLLDANKSRNKESAHVAAKDKRNSKSKERGKSHGDNAEQKRGRSRSRSKHRNKSDQEGNNDHKGAKSTDVFCEVCAGMGREKAARTHAVADCRNLRKLLNKDKQGAEKAHVTSNKTYDADEDDLGVGYLGCTVDEVTEHYGWMTRATSDNKMLVCDSAASVHIFRNRELLTHCRRIESPVTVEGLQGTVRVTETGDHPILGRVLVYPDCPANLVSLRLLAKSGKVVYDQPRSEYRYYAGAPPEEEEQHLSRQPTYTFRDNSKLFVCYPETGLISKPTYADGKFFSSTERDLAAEARSLHERLGHPSIDALSKALDAGEYINCRVTSQALRNADIIYGPCHACNRGKLTDRRPHLPGASAQTRPGGRTLHIDIMFLRLERKLVPVLLTVDNVTGHLMGVIMSSKAKTQVEDALDTVFNKYKSYDITYSVVSSDRENVFKSVEPFLNARGIQTVYTGTDEHERVSERMIRTVRERMRSITTGLTYTLNGRLRRDLFLYTLMVINMTPNNKTQPQTPRTRITGLKVDMGAHLRYAFGDGVLVKDGRTDNSDRPRSQYGIIVGHDLQSKGTVKVYLPERNTYVHEQRVQKVVLPDHITRLLAPTTADESGDHDAIVTFEDLDSPGDTTQSMSVGELIEARTFPRDSNTPPAPQPTVTQPDITRVAPAPILHQDTVTAPTSSTSTSGSIAPSVARVDSSETTQPPKQVKWASEIIAPPQNATTNTDSPAKPSPKKKAPRHTETPVTASEAQPIVTRYGRTVKPSGKLRDAYISVDSDEPDRTWEYGLMNNLTVKQAMREHPQEAKTAIQAELQQMLNMRVFSGLHPSDITQDIMRVRMPSKCFVKEKRKADGTFDKIKARLVVGGHKREANLYDDISSPTVNSATVMINVALAATEDAYAETIDFKSAYLNATLPASKPAYMKIDRHLASVLAELDSTWQKYIDKQTGELTVKINKAMYGLPESARLWYKHLQRTLTDMGYLKCESDDGLFVKRNSNGYSRICLHVDDMLHTYTDIKLKHELHEQLIRVYKDITVCAGDNLNYLGMNILLDRTRKRARVNQKNLLQEILKQGGVTGTAPQAAGGDLFDLPESSKPCDRTRFASRLMRLMYLAKKTRPDAITALAFLATRLQHPTENDWKKLVRVEKYLNGTQNYGLILSAKDITLHCYIDASFGVHADGKSHSGVYVSIGQNGGPIFVKSNKQKLVSRSSTEAELIALADGVPELLWMREIFTFLGYKIPTSIVYQDNQSTIFLAEKGKCNHGKSRFFPVKYFFVKQHVEAGDIKLVYLPTEEMIADFLTKPIQGAQHNKIRDKLVHCFISSNAKSYLAHSLVGCT